MLDFIFGTKEPLCKAADVLCNTLESYGYEVHSPALLVDATQGLSDMTGMPVNASYLTIVFGGASALFGLSFAAKSLMFPSTEKAIREIKAADVVTSVETPSEKGLALTVKPSHQKLVDQYSNVMAKEAVTAMSREALTVFNELSEAQVVAFGQQLGQALLRFRNMKPEAQIEALQALEGAGAKLKML